jgi:hypothetical protein
MYVRSLTVVSQTVVRAVCRSEVEEYRNFCRQQQKPVLSVAIAIDYNSYDDKNNRDLSGLSRIM